MNKSVSHPVVSRMPTQAELESVCIDRHGPPDTWGWGPRRRFNFRYFLPAEYYEAVVSLHIVPGSRWLDAGGGRTIFSNNSRRAGQLAQRCAKIVAVDPSKNVLENGLVHERVQCFLEDFECDTPFDLATMRMVVEHVADPSSFVGALRRLVRPGGNAIVWTVNSRSPVSLISRITPFWLHHPVKQFFWGTLEEDTFPVQYRMNTRSELRRHFDAAGFDEVVFAKLDDLSTFGTIRVLNYLELCVWKAFKSLSLSYPENCLLGIYRRREDSNTSLSTPSAAR